MPLKQIESRQIDRQTAHGFKAALPAIAIDSKRQFHIPCTIRDGSITGCKIVSGAVDELSDEIYLKVPDLERPIKGDVIWRTCRAAGIEFDWTATPDTCKRRAPRRKLNIPATVFDLNFNYLADCTIGNASRTGCRIATNEASILPYEFRIRILGLTEPVMVRLVWRKENTAGLEFFWDSEIYTLDDRVDD